MNPQEALQEIVKDLPCGLTSDGTGRQLSTAGYSRDRLLYHLAEHRDPKLHKISWCEIGCLLRFFGRRNDSSGRDWMRERLGRGFRELLDRHGIFILIRDRAEEQPDKPDFEDRKGICVKIFDASDPHDREMSQQQSSEMLKRKEISLARYERAMRALQVMFECEDDSGSVGVIYPQSFVIGPDGEPTAQLKSDQ